MRIQNSNGRLRGKTRQKEYFYVKDQTTIKIFLKSELQ